MQEYYTLKEVSEILSIKVKTLYKWVNEGKLKSVKIGGKLVRVKKEDLEEFINQSN